MKIRPSKLGWILPLLGIQFFVFSLAELQAQTGNTIRLRYFAGDRIKTNQNLHWTNYQVSWHGFGIGSSHVNIDETEGGYSDRIHLKYDDFSYTFGQRLNLTLGFGNLSSASEASSYQSATGYSWKAETISGTPSYFAVVGIEVFGFIDLIIGTRASQYKVRDFERSTASGTERITKFYDRSVGVIMTGLGIAF